MFTTVIPRPGSTFPPQDPLPGPSEQAFTSTFGALLPRAEYITTAAGRAAYFVFPPSSPSPTTSPQPSTPNIPTHVLLIYGVQTPALGLLPLITALRRDFPTTTFATLDLWGHGLSDSPVVPHEGALFHGLIHAVLGQLGWAGKRGVGIVGYSFGSVVGMGYLCSSSFEQSVGSVVLVAPAGLVRRAWFSERERTWLGRECAAHEEQDAAKFVVETLEGHPLPVVVPADWTQRVHSGQVVAQALKHWQLAHHPGHAASVVAIFRDGGVLDNDALFRETRRLGIPAFVVLGEKDGLSTEEEVRAFGFEVDVVPDAGHAVVRENAEEVAERIGRFWRGL